MNREPIYALIILLAIGVAIFIPTYHYLELQSYISQLPPPCEQEDLLAPHTNKTYLSWNLTTHYLFINVDHLNDSFAYLVEFFYVFEENNSRYYNKLFLGIWYQNSTYYKTKPDLLVYMMIHLYISVSNDYYHIDYLYILLKEA